MAELTEETKTLITALRHQKTVSNILISLAHKMIERATVHDMSKFSPEEFTGFVDVNWIARQHKLGSPEYERSIAESQAVRLHYAKNPHHPEHYEDGMAGMSILDIIEMVADWGAASLTYRRTTFEESLPIQQKRFKLTDQQVDLIRLIAREMGL